MISFFRRRPIFPGGIEESGTSSSALLLLFDQKRYWQDAVSPDVFFIGSLSNPSPWTCPSFFPNSNEEFLGWTLLHGAANCQFGSIQKQVPVQFYSEYLY